MAKLSKVRDILSWMRFSYNRSFSRASKPQIDRVMKNLIERPPHRYPRGLVSIGLTHRCQNHCEWCATGVYRKDGTEELSTAEAKQLLEQIGASSSVFNNVSFMGGECLLRADIEELVRHATGLGLMVHISTNGLMLDARQVRALVQAGLNSVFVALSPGSPKEGPETAKREKVLRGVRECVRQGLPCFFSICACKQDVSSGNIARTIELARSVGANGVRLLPVRLSGRWLWADPAKALDSQELSQLRALCRSGYAFLTDDAAREAGRSCGVLTRRIPYISPHGEVQPCHFFPFSFGNVREGLFDRVLERMWNHTMLDTACDDCLLHDPVFRSKNISPLGPGTLLPVRL